MLSAISWKNIASCRGSIDSCSGNPTRSKAGRSSSGEPAWCHRKADASPSPTIALMAMIPMKI
ncbi:hypothetical protein M1N42_01010 [Thermodesulfovibrionales bacterium]|nr:hypothetical protein [Thermodesulfovibrionales bacterium]